LGRVRLAPIENPPKLISIDIIKDQAKNDIIQDKLNEN
jgi:hypothetical protein